MKIFNTWIVNKYIAHRGLHNKNCAENSISAFKNAISKTTLSNLMFNKLEMEQ